MNRILLTACVVLVAFCSSGEYEWYFPDAMLSQGAEEIMEKMSEKEK